MTSCAWCLSVPATHRVVATDACESCATSTAEQRVRRWLQAVQERRNEMEAVAR